MAIALIILAAGQGTRMNSDLPKVLHKVAGAPLLVHAMKAGAALDPARTVIVAGHGAEAVAKAARAHDETAEIVIQEEQLGTGHAVAQALPALAGFEGKAKRSKTWSPPPPMSSCLASMPPIRGATAG